MRILSLSKSIALAFLLLGSNVSYAQVSVEETLNQALEYNPALKSSFESLYASEAEVKRVRGAYFPSIGIWANTGVRQSSNFTSKIYKQEDDAQNYAGAGVSIRQILFAGGLNRANVFAAEAGLSSSEHLLFDAATSVLFEAISAHADLARRYKLVELAKNNVKEHETVLKSTKMRFNQGVITSGEVTQVESRLARAKATLLSQESGLESAKAAYLRVVGVEAPSDIMPIKSPSINYESATKAIEVANNLNSRFLSTKDAVAYMEGEKKAAQSRFLPTISAQGGYSSSYQQGEGNLNTHGYDVGLVFEWQIFNGGSDKANLNKANANIRKAKFDSEEYKTQLYQDVYSTFARVENLFKESDFYAESMEFSRKTKNNFYQQFQAGQRGLLDVLDAESEYFTSSVEKEISYVDAIIGQYRLHALAGTLLEELDIDRETLRNR